MNYRKELEEMKRRVYEIATGTIDVNHSSIIEIAEYIDPSIDKDDVMYCRLMQAIDSLNAYIQANDNFSEAETGSLLKVNEELRRWIEGKMSNGVFLPKFKVGDWITNGRFFYRINAIDIYNNYYRVEDRNGVSNRLVFSYYDRNYQLWTINDARRGDILCTEDTVFIFSGELEENLERPFAVCGLNDRNDFVVCVGTLPWTDKMVFPASDSKTRELFDKLKSNGYVWLKEEKRLEKT